MTDNERDTHFQNAAKLLYPELKRRFTTYYERRFFEDEQGMERAEKDIQTLLAQYSYDLVWHSLEQAGDFERSFDTEIAMVDKVTDLTQWPDLPDSE